MFPTSPWVPLQGPLHYLVAILLSGLPLSSSGAHGHPHRHLSAALSQLLASSHLKPRSPLLSQCPQYTSMPLKPEHGTLSKCRFWFTMSWGARGWSAILHFQQAPGWYPCHCPWATLGGKTIQPDCPISLVGPAFPQKISCCKMISYHLYQPPLLSSCCLKHISGEQMNEMILLKNKWLIHSPYLPPLSPRGFQWQFVWISKSSNLHLKCKYGYIFLEGGVKLLSNFQRIP